MTRPSAAPLSTPLLLLAAAIGGTALFPAAARAQSDEEQIKHAVVFVREGGRWLCIHGHYTLVD